MPRVLLYVSFLLPVALLLGLLTLNRLPRWRHDTSSGNTLVKSMQSATFSGRKF